MRLIVTCCLLFASVSALANARASAAPESAANLVRLHPGPWRLPVPVVPAIRFEPETAAPSTPEDVTRGSAEAASLARAQADARARAAASVRTSADGSRHAVVGTAFRHWSVATIDQAGRLHEDCVDSDMKAQALVEAAAKKQVRK